ncbi:outer membrane beta-barrel protein [Flavobacterium sp.]|uniref:outer membrane beta-barrel protein n=1 Tax=Flavobacterium sp. TaxID=239 RepID=UPI003753E769
MKKTFLPILILVYFFSLSTKSFCQSKNDTIKTVVVDTIKPKEKKLKFGCGFGLNFVGGTSISLSPNLTYKVSDKISFGSGLQASYNAIKNLQNTTTFGANVLGYYNPSKTIQTVLEFAQLRVKTETEINAVKTSKSFWDSALFVGAGYNVTKKISVGAKYNLLYKKDESVYSSAIIPYVNISF